MGASGVVLVKKGVKRPPILTDYLYEIANEISLHIEKKKRMSTPDVRENLHTNPVCQPDEATVSGSALQIILEVFY